MVEKLSGVNTAGLDPIIKAYAFNENDDIISPTDLTKNKIVP